MKPKQNHPPIVVNSSPAIHYETMKLLAEAALQNSKSIVAIAESIRANVIVQNCIITGSNECGIKISNIPENVTYNG